ncbi:MAG TPA: AAA family ATPase, partial [Saprospiraceae bacterium]|nr:AAA family ATPase [Saprospiraceae bacterium]
MRPLFSEMGRVVIGQNYLLERLVVGMLTNGHVLLEGVPGLAKTLAVKTLAACLNLEFSRIQFTPDMLPADVVGTQIYDGQFAAVDISDKTDPQFIAAQSTPAKFNHNSGLSPDSRTLFTTDERSNAPLAAFDVSDMEHPRLLDLYYPSQKPSQEVHNVRVINNFLVNPSYGGQLTIVDAHLPDNLIETAWAVVGTSLVWDADPYLPSGIVFASAKAEGLFIFQPSYQRAGYLEGKITDASTGQPLLKARVEVTGTPERDSTDLNGIYKTGALPGTYTVVCSREGYLSQTRTGILLTPGEVRYLDFSLQPLPSSVPAQPAGDLAFEVSPTCFSDQLSLSLPVAGTLRLSDASG